MKKSFLTRATLGAVVLTILSWIGTSVQGESHELLYYLWSFPANFLVTAILGYYIHKSNLTGLKLCIYVFLIFFVIGQFNLLVEAWIFNVTSRPETNSQIFQGLIVCLIFSPIYVYLWGKIRGETTGLQFEPRSISGWIWRICLTIICYLFIYLLAGFILQYLYPSLLEFYEGKLPSFEIMIKTQLFLRAPLFAVVALLILRTMDVNLNQRIIVVGLVFTIIGGLAALIPPSDLMPQHIRIAHGLEVSLSNFVYGVLVGRLLGQKRVDPKN